MEPWKHGPYDTQLRFYQEPLFIAIKLNPSVTYAIATCLSKNNACVVTEFHQLTPCPESEVIAITLPGSFELVGWLPVVLLSELLFVRNRLAARKKAANLFYILALDGKRTLCVTTQREGGLRAILAVEWP